MTSAETLKELKDRERANRLADYLANQSEAAPCLVCGEYAPAHMVGCAVVPLASELLAPRDDHGEVKGAGW